MKLSGFRSRVHLSLGGSAAVFLGVHRWSLDDGAEALDSSCTEGYLGHGQGVGAGTSTVTALTPMPPRFGQRTSGQSNCRITLMQATLNEENNPIGVGGGGGFAGGGIQLSSGIGCLVRIFPNRDATLRRHYFPNCMITNVSHQGEVTALQPIEIQLESDSFYQLWSLL